MPTADPNAKIVFLEALEFEQGEKRSAFLAQACGQDHATCDNDAFEAIVSRSIWYPERTTDFRLTPLLISQFSCWKGDSSQAEEWPQPFASDYLLSGDV